MQQPPPRKGKAGTSLRNVHNDQLTRLQTKHQQDVDLLEDIRTFAKVRAQAEKDYGQTLLKLATTYLQKKYPCLLDIKNEDGRDQRTVYSVWCTLLDETEKIGKAKMAAADVYQTQISDSAKQVKASKVQVGRKCFDNLRKIHDEIQQCVGELDKCKKLYSEEEHLAHDARGKAHDAEEKLKKKKGRIFQSLTSLQKTSAKFSSKKEAHDIQATKARNDYILARVAANAQQKQFYSVDLPDLIQTLDCDIYSQLKEYLQLMSRTELLTCAACQSSYSNIQKLAEQVSSDYTMDCFMKDNQVLSNMIQYQFDAIDGDQVTIISQEHNANFILSKDARKWAMCMTKELRTLRDNFNELRKYQDLQAQGQKIVESTDPGGNQIDVEAKIDEIKQILRRSETSRAKAEARLEALREGGVNVDEWLKGIDLDSLAPDTSSGGLSRHGSTSSRGSRASISEPERQEPEPANEGSDSFYDSDYNDNASDISAAVQAPSVAETSSVEPYEDPLASTLAAWGDDDEPAAPVDGDVVDSYAYDNKAESVPAVGEQPVMYGGRCVAVFSYQSTNPDELSFVEQEELDILGEGDGDGWIRARNCHGQEGYIPQNYIEYIDAQVTSDSVQAQNGSFSFSSVDYDIPPGEEGTTGFPEEANYGAAPQLDIPLNMSAQYNGDIYCRAIYDYDAQADDELSFIEGDVIKIMKKLVHGDVDDGWWEGEFEGKVGIFPSLVVEELKANAEPLTPDDVITPTDIAPPPVHEPPVPAFLIPPAQVILTQPTPSAEHPGEIEEEPDPQANPDAKNYSPLVSSPESPSHAAETADAEKPSEDASKDEETEKPSEEEEGDAKEETKEEEEDEEFYPQKTDVTVVVDEVPTLPRSFDDEDEGPEGIEKEEDSSGTVVEVAGTVVESVIESAVEVTSPSVDQNANTAVESTDDKKSEDKKTSE